MGRRVSETEQLCSRCDQILPNEMFGKTSSYCKPCALEYKRAAYRNNAAYRESVIRKAKEYAESNKEKIKIYQDVYRSEHRQELNAAEKLRRDLNADEINLKRRIAWKENLSKFRENGKKAYRRRMIKILSDDNLYKKYKEECLARAKKWYTRNLDRARTLGAASSSRRRAAKKNAYVENINELSTKEELYIFQNGLCYFCGIALPEFPNSFIHLEHIIPLAKGGAHSKKNLVVACRTCNQSKNDKIIFEEWWPKLDLDKNIGEYISTPQ